MDELTLIEEEMAAEIAERVESQTYTEAVELLHRLDDEDRHVTLNGNPLEDLEKRAEAVQLGVFRNLAQNLLPRTLGDLKNILFIISEAATVSEDSDGQLIIRTNLRVVPNVEETLREII